MPADINAKNYIWFMSDDPRARIVAFEWWPVDEFTSSMTLGLMYFKQRDKPSDVWGPSKRVGEMPWVVAQRLARQEGFKVEIAETE